MYEEVLLKLTSVYFLVNFPRTFPSKLGQPTGPDMACARPALKLVVVRPTRLFSTVQVVSLFQVLPQSTNTNSIPTTLPVVMVVITAMSAFKLYEDAQRRWVAGPRRNLPTPSSPPTPPQPRSSRPPGDGWAAQSASPPLSHAVPISRPSLPLVQLHSSPHLHLAPSASPST